MTSSYARTFGLLLLLFVAGVAIALHYGPIGFFPWNQSIVFDGGWRILCGQVPYREFTLPNAIVPSVMQAGFFACLGVNWGSYVLHAALMNGIFCIVTFWFLRAFGLGVGMCFFYALLTSIFFYPPSGTPYMDQHAFLFSILGLTCLFWSERVSRQGLSNLLLVSMPPALILAYFSKQIPTIFFVAFAILYLFVNRGKYSKQAKYLLLGSTIASVLTSALIFWLWGSRWDLMRLYLFELPGSLGVERFIHIIHRQEVQAFFQVAASWQFLGILIFCATALVAYIWYHSTKESRKILGRFSSILLVILAVGISIISWYAWKVISISIIQTVMFYLVYSSKKSRLTSQARKTLWMSETFVIIGLLFISLAYTITANGLPWIMLAVGLVHSVLLQSSIGTAALKKLLAFALIVFALFDAIWFNLRINEPRSVLLLTQKELDNPHIAATIPGPLEAMEGPVFHKYRFTVRDLSVLAKYLSEQEGNFWYFGNASIIYGASRKPSVDPALWYHFGLTIPPQGSIAFEEYQERLLSAFKKFNVKHIVIEDTVTTSGCSLSEFSKIEQFIAANALDTTFVAGFPVILIRSASFKSR
jgi:hypothetical protein